MQDNNSVEAVVSLYSLHTVPDLPRFLAEAQRVLKPGRPFIFLQAGEPICQCWAQLACTILSELCGHSISKVSCNTYQLWS